MRGRPGNRSELKPFMLKEELRKYAHNSTERGSAGSISSTTLDNYDRPGATALGTVLWTVLDLSNTPRDQSSIIIRSQGCGQSVAPAKN